MKTAEQARAKVRSLFAIANSKQDYPGAYFPLKAKAQAALEQWRLDYPEEATEEKRLNEEYRTETKAQRKKDFEESFIGRGLD